MGDGVVSESELYNALVAVYEAVKINDREKLLEYLAQYKTKLYPNLTNEMVSRRLWALELALQRDNMEAANILAFYQLKKGDVPYSELSGDIKLDKYQVTELVIEALETFYRNGKQDQLKEYAEILDDKAIGVYMLRMGYQLEGLNKFKQHLTSIEKEYFKQDPQTSFEFMNLPHEMLELIIATLRGRDVMCLFMTTKQMYKSFDSFNRPEMWRRVLNNTKCVFERDFVPDDIKKKVLDIERCRRNWLQGKFSERTLFQFKATPENLGLTLDDNWVCALAELRYTMKFMNLNTEQLFDVTLNAAPYFETVKPCFVDLSTSSPLVAVYCDNGQLCYGRLGVDDIPKNVIKVCGCHPHRAFVFAQSNNRIVVAGRMQVVDLTTQQIIASNWDITTKHAMANVFNRKMSIGIDAFSRIVIYDENINPVQQLSAKEGSLIGMIDEFSLAVEVPDSGILLYDTRNFASDKYQVLMEKGPIFRDVSLDPRNQRMLARVSPHDMVAQIDLRTRKWERVWPVIPTDYWNLFPVINDRYMLQISKNRFTATVTAYDFNV